MRYARPMTRLERWIQKERARIYNALAAVDFERLVDVCLLGVIVVWLVFIEFFKR